MTKGIKRFWCSDEYKEFVNWCDKNGYYPNPLMKKYCRMTVLLDKALNEVESTPE